MKIIKYKLMTEVNHGTEEKPNIVQTFSDCEIPCSDASFDANYAIAAAEAYNGEIIVEEIEDEPAPPTEAERLAALESAMLAMMGGDPGV